MEPVPGATSPVRAARVRPDARSQLQIPPPTVGPLGEFAKGAFRAMRPESFNGPSCKFVLKTNGEAPGATDPARRTRSAPASSRYHIPIRFPESTPGPSMFDVKEILPPDAISN